MLRAPRQLRPATRENLESLPPTWRGEILDGELYAFPRPGAPHSDIEASISADLKGPFQRGRGGPGGWWILVEPGIQLPRAPEVEPDRHRPRAMVGIDRLRDGARRVTATN